MNIDPALWGDAWWRLSHLYTIVTDDGAAVPFVPNAEQRQFFDSLWTRNIIVKSRQLGFCLDPSARILTADLRWIAIGDIRPGQEVIAVDEYGAGGRGAQRRMRTAAVVASTTMRSEDRWRITLSDGRSVVCTGRHPWLTRKTATDSKWRSISGKGNEVVGRIKVGTAMRSMVMPWGEPGVEDGWMGGMLDGEGSMAKHCGSGGEVNVSQREGAVWDRLVAYAEERGYAARIEADKAERPNKFGRVPVPKLSFARLDEMMRLIGQTRPTRFIGRRFWEGKELPGKRSKREDRGLWPTVVAIEPMPPGEVVDLQTTTGTYIAEGLVSHNTTLTDLMALDQCLFNANTTAAIIAHSLDDAGRIFRNKVQRPYHALPEAVKRANPLVKETASELVFGNGSSISVSTSVRSGTVQFLHVSEMGKITRKYPERAREIVTGSFEAVPKDGIIVVESTTEGAEGWLYENAMRAHRRNAEGAKLTQLDWRLHFFPWFNKPSYRLDEPVRIEEKDDAYFDALETKLGVKLDRQQRGWYVKKRDTLGQDMKREYCSTLEESFEVALDGAIYAKEMALLRSLGRIGRVPVDPRVPVNTFWDLGLNDENAIWLHQRVGAMNRFVGYIEGTNEGMRYYWETLEKWRNQKGTPAMPIRWGRHYLPHDAGARIQGYEVETREEMLTKLGMRNIEIVPRIQDIRDGIELTRRVFQDVEIDAEECARGIKCLDHYSRTWNEDRGAWSAQPRHDWASNGADAFRQFAQGFEVERPREMGAGSQGGSYRGGY